MNTFNWAIIGTGAIAKTVAKEITESSKHKIVSVYSRTFERAESFAKNFNAKAYTSLSDAVSDNLVQGVYIATPHSAHYQNMIAVLNCNKPILCEKSFTINEKQAQHVINIAKDKNLYLAEAMWTRFNPLILKLKEIVNSGALGNILKITANFCVPLRFTGAFTPERVYKKEYGGGALLDLGVYPISFCQMLLGIPKQINCEGIVKNGIDINDNISLVYDNAVCNLVSSLSKLKSYTAKIECEKGVIKIPMFYRPSKLVVKPKNGKTQKFFAKAGYIHQFDTVAKDILENKTESANMPFCDTISVMSIMDAIRKNINLTYPLDIEKLTDI